jgi:hypothetical protein
LLLIMRAAALHSLMKMLASYQGIALSDAAPAANHVAPSGAAALTTSF